MTESLPVDLLAQLLSDPPRSVVLNDEERAAAAAAGIPLARSGGGWCRCASFRLWDVPLLLRLLRGIVPTIEVIPVVASTNDHVLANGAARAERWAAIAEVQFAGRGRSGRLWHAQAQHTICLTVGDWWRGSSARLMALPLRVGLAVAERAAAAGIDDIRLKWPNDLYRGGGKLGGILVDARHGTSSSPYIAVGIGLNQRLPAGDAAPARPMAALPDDGRSREFWAALLIDAVSEAMDTEPEADLPLLWRRWDMLAGQPIRLRTSDGEVHTGVYGGIRASGHLLLRTATGVREYASGEVTVEEWR